MSVALARVPSLAGYARTKKNPLPKQGIEKQASDVSYSGTDEIAAGAIATLTQQKSGVDTKAEAPAREVKENSTAKQSTIVKSDFEKTGRNEPCPCGSGKKFKQCHGK